MHIENSDESNFVNIALLDDKNVYLLSISEMNLILKKINDQRNPS